MIHEKYPHLFEPIKINKMILKNRIISAPLGSYTDKSLSGIAMIVRGTSGSVKDSRARMSPGEYYFANPWVASKMVEQISVIRQHGAKAEYEMCHVGQFAHVAPGDYAIGPVAFTRPDGVEVKAMDEAMMEDIANKYALTALDAKEYGFDVVMLHFAHGWLPAQFLSPLYNHRTDEYGGSFENRIKFPMMIVDRVRKAVGPDYPLDMRISGCEHFEGMQDPAEIGEFIRRIQDKIDMVHISCGLEREISANVYSSTPAYFPHKINVASAAAIKKVVDIPVAVVGAIMSPEEGEEIIASGAADMIVIGRATIADPFWVQKAWESRSEDIVPCIRCMNCYSQHANAETVGRLSVSRCTVAPRYLREGRVPAKLERSGTPKKVMVLGGGPAGMKAALTAFERGHEVWLYEKSDKLGGQLICADYDDHKLDIKRYKDYLVKQVEKSDIHVTMNSTVTRDMIEACAPDMLVVAIGATPAVPPISGIDGPNVITAVDAYTKLESLGKRVAIIGGGSIGVELAYTLGEKGHDVTVVEFTNRLNTNSNAQSKEALKQLMAPLTNITIMLETKCESITPGEIRVVDRAGVVSNIAVDSVVLAAGMKPKLDEANSYFGIVQDTNIIGDSNRVGTILEATESGYFVAATL